MQKLILAHNDIEFLKEDLRNLPQLTVLNVSHNKLSNLPTAIGEYVIFIGFEFVLLFWFINLYFIYMKLLFLDFWMAGLLC